MDSLDASFIIGIDLGTTNCAVSYVDLTVDSDSRNNTKHQIRIFKVPQLTGPGEMTNVSVLPSFLYIPGKYDIAEESIRHPWKTDTKNFSGVFARDHGSKVPSRLVSSAKSWLCHSNVDRHARVLPWGSSDEVKKVSPVDATASYLKHIKKAWNKNKGDNDELYLENQLIIITVPASFDEVARDLTIYAAKEAGLSNVTLIEEPLAAFYSWLIKHEHDWSDHVKPNELILVCDVGGGTTDFTLITLREVDGSPRFERISVGDHLILGGDNIDLALARHVESLFGPNKPSLAGDKWKTLCHQCRRAKENILDKGSDSEKITIMGEGSSLISGTVSANLTREDLEGIVVKGFFPLVDNNTRKKAIVRKGITEFGLPYEQEPEITKHLGWFLENHKEDVENVLGKEPSPDLILFNGGSLKPSIIQERIREALRFWFNEENSEVPRVLENPDPDLSVALGASYYGLVKTGIGVKVGSGSARGYYLGVAKKADASPPGNDKNHAICLVERGLDEGSNIELKDKSFEVLANQPVSFDMYSSSYRSGDRCGDLIEVDDSLTLLPPIQTIIQFGKKGAKTELPIKIEAEYTEMGTLALYCRSMSTNHKWQLQFQLRTIDGKKEVADQEVFDESLIKNIRDEVKKAFGETIDKESLTKLTKTITQIVERPKAKWPLGMIRTISDDLLKYKSARTLSPDHESRWLNLLGFCMRPGFGDGFDPGRIQKLWKDYKNGMHFEKNQQVRSEWWTLWRRVAGGLKPGHQRQFIQDLTPVLMPKKGANGKKLSPQESLEVWMVIANLEKLIVKDKIKWGKLLLNELNPKKCRHQLFWSISRIGARELLYGSVDRVVPPEEVSKWIRNILSKKWQNPKPVGAALAQMARKTGDLARDMDAETIEKIIEWMKKNKQPDSLVKYLEDVVPVAAVEKTSIFGESLPLGLVLKE